MPNEIQWFPKIETCDHSFLESLLIANLRHNFYLEGISISLIFEIETRVKRPYFEMKISLQLQTGKKIYSPMSLVFERIRDFSPLLHDLKCLTFLKYSLLLFKSMQCVN
jgi:hypothetical protein